MRIIAISILVIFLSTYGIYRYLDSSAKHRAVQIKKCDARLVIRKLECQARGSIGSARYIIDSYPPIATNKKHIISEAKKLEKLLYEQCMDSIVWDYVDDNISECRYVFKKIKVEFLENRAEELLRSIINREIEKSRGRNDT